MMDIIYSTYSQLAKKGRYFFLSAQERNSCSQLMLASPCTGCALPGNRAVVAAVPAPPRRRGELPASRGSLGEHSPLHRSTPAGLHPSQRRAEAQGVWATPRPLQINRAESRSLRFEVPVCKSKRQSPMKRLK